MTEPNESREIQPLKVLVVDDRSENLFAMEKILKPLDAVVLTAESGNEALTLLLHHNFAVALLDVQMPEMDGFELASLMRDNKKTKDVPIIFVTAISKEDRHIFKGYETGAVDYLLKPIVTEILLSKVRVFCQLYQQQRDLSSEIEKRKRTEQKNIELIAKLQDALANKEAANLALVEAKGRLRIILDSMQAGVLVVDADTHIIVEANPTMMAMIGLPRQEVIGRECCDFICTQREESCHVCGLDRIEHSSEGVLRSATGDDITVLRTAVTIWKSVV